MICQGPVSPQTQYTERAHCLGEVVGLLLREAPPPIVLPGRRRPPGSCGMGPFEEALLPKITHLIPTTHVLRDLFIVPGSANSGIPVLFEQPEHLVERGCVQ